MEYWTLFITFAKIGVMTFGGGMAMLPILQREVVENHHWATNQEMLDFYAVGQCTPGIIAVNTATLIGYRRKKTLGGIVATLGMVFPSLIIITVLAAFLKNFADISMVKHAFNGIRVCVCILILNAVLKLLKSSVTDIFTAVVFVAALVTMIIFSPSPIIYVVIAAALGIAAKLVERRRTK